MSKHKPSVVWLTSFPNRYPWAQVQTASRSTIAIRVTIYPGSFVHNFTVSRRFARLLAKRINQCLDDTK